MLRIIGTTTGPAKTAQDWREEIRDVDWGDDEDPRDQRAVDDENLDRYLVDEIEKPPEPPQRPPEAPPSIIDETREEIPTANELLGIPEGTREIPHPSPNDLVNEGMNNAELIGFDYTNRHGAYAGFRVIEPHYTFVAKTTGNEVMVGYDRDVNDIRAFIVGNIHPNGVRYESIEFEPRPEIMRGVM